MAQVISAIVQTFKSIGSKTLVMPARSVRKPVCFVRSTDVPAYVSSSIVNATEVICAEICPICIAGFR